MNHITMRKTAMALAYALLLTACPDQAQAEGRPTRAREGPAEAARDLIEQTLRKTEQKHGGDLGVWSREVIERALKRAGKEVPGAADPLPAEEHSGSVVSGLTARARGPEVIIFMSLSAPEASWRQWSREAARIGAPLVLRGLSPGGLQATVKRIGPYLDHGSGAAIDPRLFRLFDIEVVPAVAVVPGGVPPCTSRGCTTDPAPPHDRVIGNIGLEAALETVAAEGGAARTTARRHLAKLRGDMR